jgi:hypothetical protein
VTAAFISCIYVAVAGAVIGSGVLDLRVSLSLAVGVIALLLAATALLGGGWQTRDQHVRAPRRRIGPTATARR